MKGPQLLSTICHDMRKHRVCTIARSTTSQMQRELGIIVHHDWAIAELSLGFLQDGVHCLPDYCSYTSLCWLFVVVSLLQLGNSSSDLTDASVFALLLLCTLSIHKYDWTASCSARHNFLHLCNMKRRQMSSSNSHCHVQQNKCTSAVFYSELVEMDAIFVL